MIRRLYWKLRRRRFCRANGYYCPDCIYHRNIWDKDGVTYRGVKCLYPGIKF